MKIWMYAALIFMFLFGFGSTKQCVLDEVPVQKDFDVDRVILLLIIVYF